MAVAPKQGAATTPATTPDNHASEFGHKISTIVDELAVYAERSAQRRLDLLGAICARTQGARRIRDELLEPRLIGALGLANVVGHACQAYQRLTARSFAPISDLAPRQSCQRAMPHRGCSPFPGRR